MCNSAMALGRLAKGVEKQRTWAEVGRWTVYPEGGAGPQRAKNCLSTDPRDVNHGGRGSRLPHARVVVVLGVCVCVCVNVCECVCECVREGVYECVYEMCVWMCVWMCV